MGEHVLVFVLSMTHAIPAPPLLVPGDSLVDLGLSFSPWERGRAPAADLGRAGFLSGTLCKQSLESTCPAPAQMGRHFAVTVEYC